ncbi:helix-turn-helix domain-containing protein [Victivallis vadensis]|uniref:AraC-like DNA-binding protein n=1 Tax=Victivallis vadensis TaxID=172901 RepID=A0A2U1AYR1_9BACT|nr:AraC family transcriptional regulator [Victivallis vadensis]PVY41481.1 AraC-like DNA-binding protein [Victivallis vadensis]PWM80221.1 MAG: hypothetical protein DBX90_08765 [Lentisphaerota bacterium]HJH04179.1 AraC family transcriptional regulator [Victivallis vadensis]
MANHEAFSLAPFPVEILYMRYDVIQEWNLIDLQMPYWRLYRPVNACGYIHFKDRTIHLMPGKIYLIAPNTVFTTSTRGGLIEKFYLHFTIGGLYADCSDFVAELAGSPPLHGVIDRLSELLQARQGGDALKLLGCAAVNLVIEQLPQEYLLDLRNIESQMLAIWQMIKRDPTLNYSNRKLAAMAHMSLGPFIKKFYSSFAITPQHFILEKKLELAALYLLQSDESISAIAEKCGFCNRYYFTRIFTKYRKISPAAFRKHERH